MALIKQLGVLSGLTVDWKVLMTRYFTCYSQSVKVNIAIHVLTFQLSDMLKTQTNG